MTSSGGERCGTPCSTTRPRRPAALHEAPTPPPPRRRCPSSRRSSTEKLRRRRRSRGRARRRRSLPRRPPQPPSSSVTSGSVSPPRRRRPSRPAPDAARRSATRRRRRRRPRRPCSAPPGCTRWRSRKRASARSVGRHAIAASVITSSSHSILGLRPHFVLTECALKRPSAPWLRAIRTKYAFILTGRSHGELSRFTAYDPARRIAEMRPILAQLVHI